MGDADKNRLLRQLPSVSELLAAPETTDLDARHGRPAVTRAARQTVAEARDQLLRGEPLAGPLHERLATMLEDVGTSLRPVINATGVVLHTNLGRAALADAAVAAIQAAAGTCSLELDLATGERGPRAPGIEALLRELTGAEAAVAVNNGAGAVLLALSALGSGREAIVSRGELIEIGGGFRVPDVMAQSGVRLREVGTTNRTHLRDYEEAIGPDTALLVKVHRSNFAMVGFTADVATRELADLSRARGLLTLEDLGSGSLLPEIGDRTVQQAVADGADVVIFSGDKLLGGPQAGLAVGRRQSIDALRTHPLLRALRIDKLCAAALEATLTLHQNAKPHEIPALSALLELPERTAARAAKVREGLRAVTIEATVVSSIARAGAGSLPLREFPSHAVVIEGGGKGGEPLAAALRAGKPAVMARVQDGRLQLDMKAVRDSEVDALVTAVARASGPP